MNKKEAIVCPECGSKDVKKVLHEQKIEIRGDIISVEVPSFSCIACDSEWEMLETDNDYLDTAYRIYRQRHRLLQPEEIKELRKRYSLTQGELARLLGWGLVTLNRYENGALQDQAHDSALRMLEDPGNMLKLLRQRPDALDQEKRDQVQAKLKSLLDDAMESCLTAPYFDYPPSIESGLLVFSLVKCMNMILFLCKDGIYKTKLNKEMFYADFKHFKDFGKSITGLKYVHAPYGPVPLMYTVLLGSLIEKRKITVKEIVYGGTDARGDDIIAEQYDAAGSPQLSVFSDSELHTILTVKSHFSSFSSRRITNFSHEEPAYQQTREYETISYEYARELKI